VRQTSLSREQVQKEEGKKKNAFLCPDPVTWNPGARVGKEGRLTTCPRKERGKKEGGRETTSRGPEPSVRKMLGGEEGNWAENRVGYSEREESQHYLTILRKGKGEENDTFTEEQKNVIVRSAQRNGDTLVGRPDHYSREQGGGGKKESSLSILTPRKKKRKSEGKEKHLPITEEKKIGGLLRGTTLIHFPCWGEKREEKNWPFHPAGKRAKSRGDTFLLAKSARGGTPDSSPLSI